MTRVEEAPAPLINRHSSQVGDFIVNGIPGQFSDWIQGMIDRGTVIVTEPARTKKYSVEELKAMGNVGIYAKKGT